MIGERNRHGKGLAREALGLVVGYAFETLNLHKLYLRVVAFNKRALALYRAFGFVEEGVQRQHAFLRGRYYDVVLMGVATPRVPKKMFVEPPTTDKLKSTLNRSWGDLSLNDRREW